MNIERLSFAWEDMNAVAPDLLAPIGTPEQHEQALERLAELMQATQDDPDHPLLTLLDILADRIVAYESVQVTFPDHRPEQALAFLMSDRQETQVALAQATGINQAIISKLLSGERSFNLQHAQVLAQHYGVSRDTFLP